jgi:hypothetical protein
VLGPSTVLDAEKYRAMLFGQSIKETRDRDLEYASSHLLRHLLKAKFLEGSNFERFMTGEFTSGVEIGVEFVSRLGIRHFENPDNPIPTKSDYIDVDSNNAALNGAVIAMGRAFNVAIGDCFKGATDDLQEALVGGEGPLAMVKTDLLVRCIDGAVADFTDAVASKRDYLGLSLDTPTECAAALRHALSIVIDELSDPVTLARKDNYFRTVELVLVTKARSQLVTLGAKSATVKGVSEGKKIKDVSTPAASGKEKSGGKGAGGKGSGATQSGAAGQKESKSKLPCALFMAELLDGRQFNCPRYSDGDKANGRRFCAFRHLKPKEVTLEVANEAAEKISDKAQRDKVIAAFKAKARDFM